MSTSHEMNILQQSSEVVERYANCILKDFDRQSEKMSLNKLASYVLYYNDEMEYNNARNKIFDKFVNMVDSSSEELKCEEVVKNFINEVEMVKRKQLENDEKCEKYKNFMKLISEKDSQHNDVDDDEIKTVSQSINMVDPITKLPIVEPVKNKKCGHVYEKSSILQLLDRNSKTKCPIAGCNATDFVKKSDLISDPTLKRMLSKQ